MNPGFYKLDPGGDVLYSPTIVESAEYLLLAEERETYAYPVDGWSWFDSKATAHAFFGKLYASQEPTA